MKKHNWANYKRQGMTCKVGVFDEDGRQLDEFRWNVPDKKSETKIFTILKNGYGIFKRPTIKPEESVNKFVKKI